MGIRFAGTRVYSTVCAAQVGSRVQITPFWGGCRAGGAPRPSSQLSLLCGSSPSSFLQGQPPERAPFSPPAPGSALGRGRHPGGGSPWDQTARGEAPEPRRPYQQPPEPPSLPNPPPPGARRAAVAAALPRKQVRDRRALLSLLAPLPLPSAHPWATAPTGHAALLRLSLGVHPRLTACHRTGSARPRSAAAPELWVPPCGCAQPSEHTWVCTHTRTPPSTQAGTCMHAHTPWCAHMEARTHSMLCTGGHAQPSVCTYMHTDTRAGVHTAMHTPHCTHT